MLWMAISRNVGGCKHTFHTKYCQYSCLLAQIMIEDIENTGVTHKILF